MEQRAVIKFNVKLGKCASETFRLMQQVYGIACLSRSNVFVWHKRFLEGRDSLEDDEHTERPLSIRSAYSIGKVLEFLTGHRNASLKMISEALSINRETIRTIVHEDLGKTKVCARFVPRQLTDEQKSTRVDHCKDLVVAARNDPNFMKSIVTGDETWCFQYDPESKRQCAVWKSPSSPKAQKNTKCSLKNQDNAHHILR